MVQNTTNIRAIAPRTPIIYGGIKWKSAADKAGVPLYCGEFGVIDQAPTEGTVRWFSDVISVFREYGIGHAIWTYKEKDFGRIGVHYNLIREKLISILTDK